MVHFSYLNTVYQAHPPQDFVFPTQSELFLKSTFPSSQTEYLLERENKGVAIGNRLCTLEYFTGEALPVKPLRKGLTIQIWHAFGKQVVPGWFSLWRLLSRGAIALIDRDNLSREYWQTWSQYGKRYRKKWLAQNEYEIESVTEEVFRKSYQRSTLKRSLQVMFLRSMRHYVDAYGEEVHFLVAREVVTHKVIAGLMTVYDRQTSQTFHPVAFILPEAKKTYAQVGLMDYWFQEAAQKDVRFINLGVMWLPGNPPSWKGYTQFKTHFAPQVCIFAPPRIRFCWNR